MRLRMVDNQRMVSFTYERLLNFCYRCGVLGHIARDCPQELDSTTTIHETDLPYGPWLRETRSVSFSTQFTDRSTGSMNTGQVNWVSRGPWGRPAGRRGLNIFEFNRRTEELGDREKERHGIRRTDESAIPGGDRTVPQTEMPPLRHRAVRFGVEHVVKDVGWRSDNRAQFIPCTERGHVQLTNTIVELPSNQSRGPSAKQSPLPTVQPTDYLGPYIRQPTRSNTPTINPLNPNDPSQNRTTNIDSPNHSETPNPYLQPNRTSSDLNPTPTIRPNIPTQSIQPGMPQDPSTSNVSNSESDPFPQNIHQLSPRQISESQPELNAREKKVEGLELLRIEAKIGGKDREGVSSKISSSRSENSQSNNQVVESLISVPVMSTAGLRGRARGRGKGGRGRTSLHRRGSLKRKAVGGGEVVGAKRLQLNSGVLIYTSLTNTEDYCHWSQVAKLSEVQPRQSS